MVLMNLYVTVVMTTNTSRQGPDTTSLRKPHRTKQENVVDKKKSNSEPMFGQ